jgi:AcrR family transcriptional regulator
MPRGRQVRSEGEIVRHEAGGGSRERLLTAGKALFARLGYEQTSTSAITRHAETSESQLTRHFEGKRGLLAAIFDESWRAVNEHIRTVAAQADSATTAIEAVLATVIAAFDRDPDLAALFLFEGRRVHTGEHNVVLSQGYLEFVDFLHNLIRRAQAEQNVGSGVNVRALCSALIGAAEGMMRDRLIAQRASGRAPFSPQDVRRVFGSLLHAPSRQSAAKARRKP